MGIGTRNDIDNRFSKKQSIPGVVLTKKGIIQKVEEPVAATSTINITTDELGRVYSDTNRTSGSTISIVLPSHSISVGQEVTVVHARDTHVTNVTAVAPPTTDAILGQTAGKSLYATAKGASITLGATADGWYVKNSHGTWTEEP